MRDKKMGLMYHCDFNEEGQQHNESNEIRI